MRQFVSMEEAFGEIKERAAECQISTARVPIEEAVGRVLAEPAVAELSIPPFNNSARDGVALSAAGLDAVRSGTPIPLAGELRAGDSVEVADGIRGDAVRIMTGAPVPVWADTIVMIENLDLKDDGTVVVNQSPEPGVTRLITINLAPEVKPQSMFMSLPVAV